MKKKILNLAAPLALNVLLFFAFFLSSTAFLSANADRELITNYDSKVYVNTLNTALRQTSCEAEAGTLTANVEILCLNTIAEFTGRVANETQISANSNGNTNVPTGFGSLFLLSKVQGADLVITESNRAPIFEVTSGGNYGIHTLIYDPNTLDLNLIEMGNTKIVELSRFLIQDGGEICGSLDIDGASIIVEAPTAEILNIDANPVFLDVNVEAAISATPRGTEMLPLGYIKEYFLTQGADRIIVDRSSSSSFVVNRLGDFRIHELVYNPLTLDLEALDIDFGVTSAIEIHNLFTSRGGDICGALDIFGAQVTVVEAPCLAETGTLLADTDVVCLDVIDEFTESRGNETRISATPQGDILVPFGFESIYLLSEGSASVIADANIFPVFEVLEGNNFGIHTLVYNPNTLDLSLIEYGGTTVGDISRTLKQGGGNVCGVLDLIGTKISVEAPTASQLIVEFNQVVLDTNVEAVISAIPNTNSIVPLGYNKNYFLVQSATGLIIESAPMPSFIVNNTGDYRIHELVYNPLTLDLEDIDYGVTILLEVYNLLTSRGGNVCGSLDIFGAEVEVIEAPCTAETGTLLADTNVICLDTIDEFTGLINNETRISATPNGDILVPFGFENLFLLSQGSDSVIIETNFLPVFEVLEGNNYGIHTLVYNPNTLDTSLIELGSTKLSDISNDLKENGGDTCGALDIIGASIIVEAPKAEMLTINKDTVELDTNVEAVLSATSNGTTLLPSGYNKLYLLTQEPNFLIMQSSSTPDFVVNNLGDYKIHELIYNPLTLDIDEIEYGVTSALVIYNSFTSRGGDICGAFDIFGADVTVVKAPCIAEAGTLIANADTICFTKIDEFNSLTNREAEVSAAPNGDMLIPFGFESLYLLSQGVDFVFIDKNETPEFLVNEGGNYTIHSLVYNPNTLDLSLIENRITTLEDLSVLIEQGELICASLDTEGASTRVEAPEAGRLIADKTTVIFDVNGTSISATSNSDSSVPENYNKSYLLTQGSASIITASSSTPDFVVDSLGDYRIHEVVYNPLTLDLNTIDFGITELIEIYNSLTPRGGDICGSLEIRGADIVVIEGLLSTKDVTKNQIVLYPNPVKSKIHVNLELKDYEEFDYTIFDLSGRQMSKGLVKPNNSKTVIDVNELKSGVYIITFTSKYQKITKKIRVNK